MNSNSLITKVSFIMCLKVEDLQNYGEMLLVISNHYNSYKKDHRFY